MSKSHQAGASFIQGLLADFEALSEKVEGLSERTDRLQAGLAEESRVRNEAALNCISELERMAERADGLNIGLIEERGLRNDVVTALLSQTNNLFQHIESLSATLAAEQGARCEAINSILKSISDVDQVCLERTDEVATSLADWTTRLGVQSAHCSEIQAQVDDVSGQLHSNVEKMQQRLAELESTVARNDKDTLSDLGRLRCSLNTAEEGAKNRHSDMQRDVNKMAAAADLSQAVAKMQSLESIVEAHLKLVGDELGRKASLSEFQSFRDSCSSLTSEIGLNRKLLKELESVISPLPGSIQTLTTSVKLLDRRQDSLDRRQETESERSNACWVALQKELGTKPARSEFEPLVARVGTLEDLALKARLSETPVLLNRLEAFEVGLNAKADSRAFEKTRLAVSDQSSRQDELEARTTSKLAALSAQVNCLGIKSEESAILFKQITKCHDEIVAGLKDEFEVQLQQFYPKAEIDAQFSRVWWRLGQSGKVVGLGVLKGKPDRPQSARTQRDP